jgi:flagellar biosynthesis/type III secretory pathway M-ring protein FliF/YscJ
MITTALGIDTGRGDRIEVVAMPFKQNMLEISETGSGSAVNDYIPYIKVPDVNFLRGVSL